MLGPMPSLGIRKLESILDNLAKQAYKKVKRAKNETDRKSETDSHWKVDRQRNG